MSERMRNGRRKIEIEKISRKSNLQASFSKRRYGLFKKASELSTICGAEVAVITFSPGDEVFSFGYPSVDSVLESFNQFPNQSNVTIQQIQHHANANANLHYLNAQITEINDQLDEKNKHGKELARCWWKHPIDEMHMTQLKQFKARLELLRSNIKRRSDELQIKGSSVRTHQFFEGNSSCSQPQLFAGNVLSNRVSQFYQLPFQVFDREPMINSSMLQNPMLPYDVFDGNMDMVAPPLHGSNNDMGGGGYRPGFY